MTRIPAETLRQFAEAVFGALGVDEERARLLADGVLQGALRGHPGQGQGMGRLRGYVNRVSNDEIDVASRPQVITETPVLTLIDGQNGFGQVIATEAMHRAMDKASAIGVGVTGVRHSNHLGITAYTAMLALERDQIGICLSNAGPEMAPWGGLTPLLGTNPWGVAVPTGGDFPIVLDMALTTSGKGMMRWRAREGLPMPATWALTRDGQVTTDPAAADDGPLLPIGEFKGTGLSLITDILSGVLTGAAFGSRPYADSKNHDVGHFMIAIDIAPWLPLPEFQRRVQDFMAELKTSHLAPGFDEILLPGELEHRRTVERLANGVPVADDTLADLHALAAQLAIDDPLPAPSGVASGEVLV
jgi:LDH2 family malate/lactate/ureidoglycolate dehydrogenase